MEIIKKTIKLNKEDFYKKHLSIINPVLPIQLTQKEIEVLAAFMLASKRFKDPFGKEGRKLVKNIVEISTGGLGNYLDQLKSKGFLLLNSNKEIEILPILKPKNEIQIYQFKLETNEE